MLRIRPRTQTGAAPIGDLDPRLSALLRARGITDPESAQRFLNPSLDQLTDPELMPGMAEAVRLIREAVAAGDPVTVYGDYDCDGVCATAILTETLEELGASVSYCIPNRHLHGYGLNADLIRELAEKGCRLLVTVDCGITNLEEVRLARSLGLKVIVTDHHRFLEDDPGSILRTADAVINPLLPGSPYDRLCGAGVALKLSQALQGPEVLEKRLDLAALATVADIVPLTGENRVIVAEGLKRIGSGKRPGLAALKTCAGIGDSPDTADLGYRLGPRINAGGRLGDAARCVRLLKTRDPAEAEALAMELETANRDRQDLQAEITGLAEAMVLREVRFRDDRCIVVMGEGWESGIVGLAAGKLCEKYHWPTIVLSLNPENGLATGSCRSIPGINIHRALTRCEELYAAEHSGEKLFTRFGGHEMAAGLTVREELVPSLKALLNRAIGEMADPLCFVPEAEYDQTLRLEDLTLNLIRSFSRLEPTGCQNPAPVFLASQLTPQIMKPVGQTGAHLKVRFADGSGAADGIAYNKGHLAQASFSKVDVLFEPQIHEFRGVVSPEMVVQEIRSSAGQMPLPAARQLFPSFLQEITWLAENNSKMSCCGETPRGIRVQQARDLLMEGLGTLVVAHDRERALNLAGIDPMPDLLLQGDTPDPRGFCTIAFNPAPADLPLAWKRILLADGDLLPGELDWLRSVFPDAEFCALEETAALRRQLQDMRPDRSEVGAVYRLLYSLTGDLHAPVRAVAADVIAGKTGLSPEKVMVSLTVLNELSLIDYQTDRNTASWRSSAKCELNDAPLMRYLNPFS